MTGSVFLPWSNITQTMRKERTESVERVDVNEKGTETKPKNIRSDFEAADSNDHDSNTVERDHPMLSGHGLA